MLDAVVYKPVASYCVAVYLPHGGARYKPAAQEGSIL